MSTVNYDHGFETSRVDVPRAIAPARDSHYIRPGSLARPKRYGTLDRHPGLQRGVQDPPGRRSGIGWLDVAGERALDVVFEGRQGTGSKQSRIGCELQVGHRQRCLAL